MDAHKNIHKAPQWKAISKRLAGVREDHCEVWMGVRKCSFQPLCHLRVVGWWCLLVLSFSGEHRYFNSDKKLWKTEIGRWEPQLRYTYRDPRNHLHTGIWWCLVADLITLGKPITTPQVPRPPSTRAHLCGRWISSFPWPSGEGDKLAVISILQTNWGLPSNQGGAEKGLSLDFYHTASVCIRQPSPRDSCGLWSTFTCLPIARVMYALALARCKKNINESNFYHTFWYH